VPFSLRAGFGEKDYPHLVGEAESLADSFLNSEWGRRAREARERETEFPFLFRHRRGRDDYLIRGTIDLYFIEQGCAHLIDFKTDRVLNRPEYEAQLGIYSAALADYTGLEVRAGLYALRTGEMIRASDDFDPDEFFAKCQSMMRNGG
jgi:ATP-dependent exoDNAse (exonuclease V) beta subunit